LAAHIIKNITDQDRSSILHRIGIAAKYGFGIFVDDMAVFPISVFLICRLEIVGLKGL